LADVSHELALEVGSRCEGAAGDDVALITTPAIRRGSFDSVADLRRKIDEFVKHYNQHPRPFMWIATAESILAKSERLRKVINCTRH